jgi:hypothetical protein
MEFIEYLYPKKNKNAGNIMQCRVLVVYPPDHMADWELQPAHHLQGVLYNILLA